MDIEKIKQKLLGMFSNSQASNGNNGQYTITTTTGSSTTGQVSGLHLSGGQVYIGPQTGQSQWIYTPSSDVEAKKVTCDELEIDGIDIKKYMTQLDLLMPDVYSEELKNETIKDAFDSWLKALTTLKKAASNLKMVVTLVRDKE